jgi:hypothetical protein
MAENIRGQGKGLRTGETGEDRDKRTRDDSDQGHRLEYQYDKKKQESAPKISKSLELDFGETTAAGSESKDRERADQSDELELDPIPDVPSVRPIAARIVAVNVSKRLNRIFSIYEEVREADVKQDRDLLEMKLIDGLAVSCLLLQDLEKFSAIGSLVPPEPIGAVFRRLKEEKELDQFFSIERDMLRRADVKDETADDLVYATQQVIDYLIENNPEHEPDWRLRLSDLVARVCPAARDAAKIRANRPLLRAAAIVAGGAVLSVLAIVSVPATLVLSHASVAVALYEVGKWVIQRGAEGALKERYQQ